MHLIEVSNKKEERDFYSIPDIIYKNDPNWISHLDVDVKAVFNPLKNKNFLNGVASRWILKNTQGELIGRIAAFIDKELAYTYEYPTGGMGFFECINDNEAAFLLFDIARKWLQEHGMKAMEGPVNFGEKDRFWGLMVEGQNVPPPYLINYNPLYYKDFFEAYGFKNYYEQYIYSTNKYTPVPPLIERIYERLTKNNDYEFININIKEIDRFADDFMFVYNKAWGDVHKNFNPLTKEQALDIFRSMKDVIDEDIIIFAYHKGNPIAFFVNIPELNQIFRHLKGKLNLWGKLKFLYYKKKKTCNTIYGLVFGIIPEYRNKGIESGLIISVRERILRKNTYTNAYLAWIGDFNPKMIKITELFTKDKAFTLVTYLKLFDDTLAFKRHPVIE